LGKKEKEIRVSSLSMQGREKTFGHTATHKKKKKGNDFLPSQRVNSTRCAGIPFSSLPAGEKEKTVHVNTQKF